MKKRKFVMHANENFQYIRQQEILSLVHSGDVIRHRVHFSYQTCAIYLLFYMSRNCTS